MQLIEVDIDGYRSMSKGFSLRIEPGVTVILGANDHGKTNLLEALRHLNPDNPFNKDPDLNWDHESDPENFPHVTYKLGLSKQDRAKLLEIANSPESRIEPETQAADDASETEQDTEAAQGRGPDSSSPESASNSSTGQSSDPQQNSTSEPSDSAPSESGEKSNGELAGPDADSAQASEESAEGAGAQAPKDVKPEHPRLTLRDMPHYLKITRRGVEKNLEWYADVQLGQDVQLVDQKVLSDFIDLRLPRVELIKPVEKIPDSAKGNNINMDDYEFMRGIFHYGGLDPKESARLFVQNDRSMRELQDASVKLNETLKADWSQGQNLEFQLSHESKTDEIILRIRDPAVETQLVRASRRSSGFTHFFALKTILYARMREHPANTYIFLFDEPGIYLHPEGQRDLIRVLDNIGKSNQIVYSTHSIFMINKNYPARHRLIKKDEKGTQIDGKPYTNRWRAVIDNLGSSLVGTIFFAPYVLLAEGDSDPLLVQGTLQKLVLLNQTKIDLNAFAVLATGNSRDAHSLIRVLSEGANPPTMAVLFDGDRGGADRLKNLKKMLQKRKILFERLPEGTTIEDHLPLAKELYVQAVANYVIDVMKEGERPPRHEEELQKKFKRSYTEFAEAGEKKGQEELGEHKKGPKLKKDANLGIATWAEEAAKELGGFTEGVSRIGIAREYLRLLEDTADSKLTRQATKGFTKVLKLIQEMLHVPEIAKVSTEVMES